MTNRAMNQNRAIEIIKNLPSATFSKQEKKEALAILQSRSIIEKYITKNEMYNAIIYLLDMVDYDKADWNGV